MFKLPLPFSSIMCVHFGTCSRLVRAMHDAAAFFTCEMPPKLRTHFEVKFRFSQTALRSLWSILPLSRTYCWTKPFAGLLFHQILPSFMHLDDMFMSVDSLIITKLSGHVPPRASPGICTELLWIGHIPSTPLSASSFLPSVLDLVPSPSIC